MNTYTTISGRTINVSANKSKRTFTIVTESAKYRTLQMSREEFESCEFNTADDWQNLLRTDAYYQVK